MPVPTPRQITKRFVAQYQPIVDLNAGAVMGFEALARMIGSDGAGRSAGKIIERIERRPDTLKALIRTILTCIRRDMVPLFERHPHFYVSVNIPPVVLGSGEVARLLEDLDLAPYLSRIACEVTERQVLTSVGRSALERARRSGMIVAVDDFGTGHSGLMQIAGLDFDVLKRSFPDRKCAHQPNRGQNAPRHRRPGRRAAPAHRGRRSGNLGRGFFSSCRRR
jgi:sensor c-di-GMP phosphodiesterase-like protein